MTRSNCVTVKNNPSKQERDRKIKEISFTNSDNEYYGLLMRLGFDSNNKPIVHLYRIDEGISVSVSDTREKRW